MKTTIQVDTKVRDTLMRIKINCKAKDLNEVIKNLIKIWRLR